MTGISEQGLCLVHKDVVMFLTIDLDFVHFIYFLIIFTCILYYQYNIFCYQPLAPDLQTFATITVAAAQILDVPRVEQYPWSRQYPGKLPSKFALGRSPPNEPERTVILQLSDLISSK